MATTKLDPSQLEAELDDDGNVKLVNLSPVKRKERAALDALAELGGASLQDEDVVFEGNRLIIPASMTMKQCIDFLVRKLEQEEKEQTVQRTFRYRPWDGAFCTWQAFKRAFGAVAHNSTTVQGFFGPQKIEPQTIGVYVGPGEQIQVPWGDFEVPFLPGVEISLDQVNDREFGPLFHVSVTGPRKWRHHVEGLLNLVKEELETNSIYRGKAIDGQTMPEFMDLSGIDRSKVIYSEDVQVQLEANIWTLLRYSEQQRRLRIPLKRAVLIEGPYGTGKTLAATLTAQEAQEHGWTFIYARPAKDDLGEVMQTARLYQPAVVFFEDMDTIASPAEGEDGISKMLDLFDGITAKGTEIVAILTTNHPERIHKGMVRPGRLDSVIHIGPLDAVGIEKLIRASVPGKMLSDKVDWSAVADAAEGFMPAFVKEAADRAVRYALARNGGKDDFMLDSEDFVNAANGLRPQLELMDAAEDTHSRDALTVVTEGIVTKAVRDNLDPNFLLSEDQVKRGS